MQIETLIEKLQVIRENNKAINVRIAIEKNDGFYDRSLDEIKVIKNKNDKEVWLVT